MTKEFFEEVMRIPSVSQHEDMMIEFLMDWGPKHGCKTKKDGKGNVYMEKGSGIRPTLINHVDTVHHDQEEMVKQKVYKEIIWNGDNVTAKNPLTGKQTGLGMDNQGGACIALAVIDRLKAVKAIFTVEEEIGMNGIRAADMSFFDDAAFVFSNDSPDENRATHYSSGVQLYSDDFFKKYLEPICKKHGVTSFRSEPFTCIKVVRSQWKNKDGKHIECLNFGNAGGHPHTDKEDASFKGVNNAEELLYALCTEIPTDVQHVSDISEEPRPSYSWSNYSGYRSSYSSPWRSSWNGGNDKFESKGHFVWAFNTPAIKDKYVERMRPRFGETLKIEEVGKQSVKVSGEFLYLRSAYMFAFNYDNGTSYTSWMDFERNERTAAGRFDSDFKADPVEKKKEPAGENWRKKQHGQYDDGVVYVRIDSDEDMDVVETRIFDSGVPVDMEREPEGLSIAGPLVSIQRAFAIASDALNGTNYRFFPNLDKESQDEFWKSVAFDNDEDEGEFDDVIDADYTMVDDKPPADSDDEGDDLFSWMRKQQQKKEEPKKDDLLRGHSPDEMCSMKLQLPLNQAGFAAMFKSKVGDRVSIAEIGENALEISGKLSDVVAAALEYMNLWLRSDRYRSLADLPPSQIDNFWKELEFKK